MTKLLWIVYSLYSSLTLVAPIFNIDALPALSDSLTDSKSKKEFITVAWFGVTKEVAVYLLVGLYSASTLLMVIICWSGCHKSPSILTLFL
jgi:hypothetical protein